MSQELTGIIKHIGDLIQVTEKFSKREFVITTADQYPQQVSFQLVNKHCEWLDQYSIGEEVRVIFSIGGKEWKSPKGEVKYFNTLTAYHLTLLNKAVDAPQQKPPTSVAELEGGRVENLPSEGNADDLPF